MTDQPEAAHSAEAATSAAKAGEARRAALLDRAFADGKGIEEALALAARAEAFITGAVSAEAILHTQSALPPPPPRAPVVGKGAQPLTDAGPAPGEEARKPARGSGKRWRWSAEDIAYLRQVYTTDVSMAEIMARLVGRPLGSIRTKVRLLGLKRSLEFRNASNRMASRKKYERRQPSIDPSPADTLGLDPAFAAVMADVVAWFEERGDAVSRDQATGGYLFRGDTLTPHQLVVQANAVRRRLSEPLFALPDADPPSAPGMGTAAGMLVEAAP